MIVAVAVSTREKSLSYPIVVVALVVQHVVMVVEFSGAQRQTY